MLYGIHIPISMHDLFTLTNLIPITNLFTYFVFRRCKGTTSPKSGKYSDGENAFKARFIDINQQLFSHTMRSMYLKQRT